MTKRRRTYDKEFKEQVVNMFLNQGFTREEVSKRLDIGYNSITNLVKKTEKDWKLSAHKTAQGTGSLRNL